MRHTKVLLGFLCNAVAIVIIICTQGQGYILSNTNALTLSQCIHSVNNPSHKCNLWIADPIHWTQQVRGFRCDYLPSRHWIPKGLLQLGGMTILWLWQDQPRYGSNFFMTGFIMAKQAWLAFSSYLFRANQKGKPHRSHPPTTQTLHTQYATTIQEKEFRSSPSFSPLLQTGQAHLTWLVVSGLSVWALLTSDFKYLWYSTLIPVINLVLVQLTKRCPHTDPYDIWEPWLLGSYWS